MLANEILTTDVGPIDDGLRYLRTVEGGLRRRAIFTPDMLREMLAMGLEAMISGFLQQKGIFPAHSSLDTLLVYLKRMETFPEEMSPALRELQAMVSPCSNDKIDTGYDDIEDLLACSMQIRDWILMELT